MEHETFLSLLHDAAHWQFEIFLMILFDGVLGLIVWPFVRKHWRHHLERDEQDGCKRFYDTPRFPVAGRTAQATEDFLMFYSGQTFIIKETNDEWVVLYFKGIPFKVELSLFRDGTLQVLNKDLSDMRLGPLVTKRRKPHSRKDNLS